MYYKYVNERKSAVREARRQSRSSNMDNPTQPLLSRRRSSANSYSRSHSFVHNDGSRSPPAVAEKEGSIMTVVAKNILSLLAVMLVGCLGWFLAWKSGAWSVTVEDGNKREMPWIGTFLGYTSAVLYLSARIPQILKNHHNKSCDGML